MAFSGENSGMQNLLVVGGAALFGTLATVFWLSESMETRGSSQGGPTFQASQPAEGTQTCSNCQGRGRAACDTCRGLGKVIFVPGGEDWCPTCAGYKTYTCQRCKGTGMVAFSRPGSIKVNGLKVKENSLKKP